MRRVRAAVRIVVQAVRCMAGRHEWFNLGVPPYRGVAQSVQVCAGCGAVQYEATSNDNDWMN